MTAAFFPRDLEDVDLMISSSGGLFSDPFDSIERRDGAPFDSEDEHALLEFGGMLVLATQLLAPLLQPASAAAPRATEPAPDATTAPCSTKMLRTSPSEAESDDDEEEIHEFSGLALFFTMVASPPSTPEERAGGYIGLFPAEDEDLSRVGASWGRGATAVRQLERVDGQPMTQDDADALLPYGAWVCLATTSIEVYRRVFGYTAASSSTSGIKRSPSGAELSAALGRTIQNSLGLDDPNRKVRARGIL